MEILIGGLVSLIVEIAKRYLGTSTFGTIVFLGGASLLVSGGLYYFSTFNFWPAFLQIVTSAAAFHNLVIRQLQNKEK